MRSTPPHVRSCLQRTARLAGSTRYLSARKVRSRKCEVGSTKSEVRSWKYEVGRADQEPEERRSTNVTSNFGLHTSNVLARPRTRQNRARQRHGRTREASVDDPRGRHPSRDASRIELRSGRRARSNLAAVARDR